jgi:hypothetical protein
MPSPPGTLVGIGAPVSELMELTKIPIVTYYSDRTSGTSIANPGQDQWLVRLAMARLWADAVNRRGTTFRYADILSAYLMQKRSD